MGQEEAQLASRAGAATQPPSRTGRLVAATAGRLLLAGVALVARRLRWWQPGPSRW